MASSCNRRSQSESSRATNSTGASREEFLRTLVSSIEEKYARRDAENDDDLVNLLTFEIENDRGTVRDLSQRTGRVFQCRVLTSEVLSGSDCEKSTDFDSNDDTSPQRRNRKRFTTLKAPVSAVVLDVLSRAYEEEKTTPSTYNLRSAAKTSHKSRGSHQTPRKSPEDAQSDVCRLSSGASLDPLLSIISHERYRSNQCRSPTDGRKITPKSQRDSADTCQRASSHKRSHSSPPSARGYDLSASHRAQKNHPEFAQPPDRSQVELGRSRKRSLFVDHLGDSSSKRQKSRQKSPKQSSKAIHNSTYSKFSKYQTINHRSSSRSHSESINQTVTKPHDSTYSRSPGYNDPYQKSPPRHHRSLKRRPDIQHDSRDEELDAESPIESSGYSHMRSHHSQSSPHCYDLTVKSPVSHRTQKNHPEFAQLPDRSQVELDHSRKRSLFVGHLGDSSSKRQKPRQKSPKQSSKAIHNSTYSKSPKYQTINHCSSSRSHPENATQTVTKPHDSTRSRSHGYDDPYQKSPPRHHRSSTRRSVLQPDSHDEGSPIESGDYRSAGHDAMWGWDAHNDPPSVRRTSLGRYSHTDTFTGTTHRETVARERSVSPKAESTNVNTYSELLSHQKRRSGRLEPVVYDRERLDRYRSVSPARTVAKEIHTYSELASSLRRKSRPREPLVYESDFLSVKENRSASPEEHDQCTIQPELCEYNDIPKAQLRHKDLTVQHYSRKSSNSDGNIPATYSRHATSTHSLPTRIAPLSKVDADLLQPSLSTKRMSSKSYNTGLRSARSTHRQCKPRQLPSASITATEQQAVPPQYHKSLPSTHSVSEPHTPQSVQSKESGRSSKSSKSAVRPALRRLIDERQNLTPKQKRLYDKYQKAIHSVGMLLAASVDDDEDDDDTETDGDSHSASAWSSENERLADPRIDTEQEGDEEIGKRVASEDEEGDLSDTGTYVVNDLETPTRDHRSLEVESDMLPPPPPATVGSTAKLPVRLGSGNLMQSPLRQSQILNSPSSGRDNHLRNRHPGGKSDHSNIPARRPDSVLDDENVESASMLPDCSYLSPRMSRSYDGVFNAMHTVKVHHNNQ